ncbi:hypothetical protein ACMFMF_006593 [Clarireedia jacksonii]
MAAEQLNKFHEAVNTVDAEVLLPAAIDLIAKTNPERLYAEMPLSATTFDTGFRKISYSELSNAVNGIPWWIHHTLGSSKTCEPLCYIGPNDLVRNLVLPGNCKAGYSTLMMTPRFNALAHKNFIDRCNCNKMIMPQGPDSADPSITALYHQVLRAPSLEELLYQKHPYFAFESSFEDPKTEPLVILHTSGMTGFPKYIIWSHDYVANFVKERGLDPPEGFKSNDKLLLGGKLICAFPPAHAGPTWATLMFTVYCGSTMVYLLSGLLPSVNMLVECVKHKIFDALMIVPPQIEELATNSEALLSISQKAETMFYAGGDVSLAAGDAISLQMKLITICGSIEQGFWHTLHPTGPWNPKIWKYMRPHPAQKVAFRHQSEDLYEATYIRNDGPKEYL